MHRSTMPYSALAEERDAGGVAAERRDVLLHPLQGQTLVQHACST